MNKLITWVEIPANNFEKAVEFYSKTFNLDLKPMDFGEEKMACFPYDEGAISKSPGFKPSSDGVLVSFNAGSDLNVVIERALKCGGEVVKHRTKIEAEGRGYFALIKDCEGNTIGLYEA